MLHVRPLKSENLNSIPVRKHQHQSIRNVRRWQLAAHTTQRKTTHTDAEEIILHPIFLTMLRNERTNNVWLVGGTGYISVRHKHRRYVYKDVCIRSHVLFQSTSSADQTRSTFWRVNKLHSDSHGEGNILRKRLHQPAVHSFLLSVWTKWNIIIAQYCLSSVDWRTGFVCVFVHSLLILTVFLNIGSWFELHFG